jgi:hypothetical protein
MVPVQLRGKQIRCIALRGNEMASRELATHAKGVVRRVDDVEATPEVKPVDPLIHHEGNRHACIHVDVDPGATIPTPASHPTADHTGTHSGLEQRRTDRLAHAPAQGYTQDQIHSVGLFLEDPLASSLGEQAHAPRFAAARQYRLHSGG